jgi:2-polyprenyl-6-methoxyphenol hydroxylase-like FAD-dependent oxidoreductase
MQRPILIVGAGPTGLVLALWLSRIGVNFRIIEKNSGPGQASRAMAVQARTLEFYRQLGIADDVFASGIKLHGIRLRRGSKEITGFNFGDFGNNISPYPLVLSFPQDDHEHLLVRHLKAAGVEIEWNTELNSFFDDGDCVRTTLTKGDRSDTTEFSYLCGCDGARSTVREHLKIGFPGGTYQQIFFVADVHLQGIDFGNDVNLCLNSTAFCLVFPVRSSGTFRLVGVVPPELANQKDLTFDPLKPFVKEQFGADVTQVNWFSTYHVHHRVAEHFRVGRAFLAGDAGHIHSPAGGQGMNTGIGDAVNLAWKLAAVVKGTSNPSILDTYETERIRFARSLVKTTDRLFQGIVGHGPGSLLMRSVFFPYILPLVLTATATRRAQFRLVSQTRINYRHSALNSGTAGEIHGGDRLPWLGSQDNFKPLSSLDWQIHICGSATDALRSFANSQKLPVHIFQWDDQAKSAGFAKDAMYLVRPDGHVALADSQQDIAALGRYLSQWKNTHA